MPRPYELLARFKNDGSIGGIIVRYIETVGGKDFELDPVELSGISDPAFSDFANAFNAALISERDQLSISADSVPKLQARIDELEALVDSLQNPLKSNRKITPFEFLSRFSIEEIVALQTSTDPMVCVGRAKLQTIITFVDLDLPETIGLVQYLESIGILTSGRSAEILRDNK